VNDDDQYRFMYRDASNSIAALDQKLAAYRDLIDLWQLVAAVLTEYPTHHKKCTAGLDKNKPVDCDRCKSLAMLEELRKATNAIL
jgi:hypothetical protein